MSNPQKTPMPRDIIIEDPLPPLEPREEALSDNLTLENILPMLKAEGNPTGWRLPVLLRRAAQEVAQLAIGAGSYDRAQMQLVASDLMRLADKADELPPQDQLHHHRYPDAGEPIPET